VIAKVTRYKNGTHVANLRKFYFVGAQMIIFNP